MSSLSLPSDTPNVVPMKDGHAVARSSDFIVYSVEAEYIDRVVAEYGPCKSVNFSRYLTNPIQATKVHAVVAGQTSVKAPEKVAFEKHLPSDVHIVSCHSLHGPSVSPVGQPLVSDFPTSLFGAHPQSDLGFNQASGNG